MHAPNHCYLYLIQVAMLVWENKRKKKKKKRHSPYAYCEWCFFFFFFHKIIAICSTFVQSGSLFCMTTKWSANDFCFFWIPHRYYYLYQIWALSFSLAAFCMTTRWSANDVLNMLFDIGLWGYFIWYCHFDVCHFFFPSFF